MLRLELGFYVGCLNFLDRLTQKGEPTCFPTPLASGKAMLSARGLYDPCLSLSMEERAVGNDLGADGKLLVMMTGASRGGKSTLPAKHRPCPTDDAVRNVRAGAVFPRKRLRCRLYSLQAGRRCHYEERELDQELSRMSSIVDNLSPNSIVLFNESFASTNEREGSEIARHIVRALLETGIKVFYVTHLFVLVRGFHRGKMQSDLFLRRKAGRWTANVSTRRRRTIANQLCQDLYRRIFAGSRSTPYRFASGVRRHRWAAIDWNSIPTVTWGFITRPAALSPIFGLETSWNRSRPTPPRPGHSGWHPWRPKILDLLEKWKVSDRSKTAQRPPSPRAAKSRRPTRRWRKAFGLGSKQPDTFRSIT